MAYVCMAISRDGRGGKEELRMGERGWRRMGTQQLNSGGRSRALKGGGDYFLLLSG